LKIAWSCRAFIGVINALELHKSNSDSVMWIIFSAEHKA